MWIRLRQIALVAADLRRVSLELGAVLGLEACHTDPGVGVFGLKNTLWPVGNQFLEVVTPITDGTAAGRYLERRGGDGGYMVITQVEDVAECRRRAEALGIRVAHDVVSTAHGHDGVQLHPADTGGSLLELDQVRAEGGEAEDGPWWPAGRAWKPYVRTDRVTAVTGVELQSPEPGRLAERWATLAGSTLGRTAEGHPRFMLDNAEVRVVPDEDGRGEGLGGIDLAVVDLKAMLASADLLACPVDGDMILIGGLRVRLRSVE